MSKDQVVLKVAGLAVAGVVAAVGGLYTLLSNKRTPVEQHLRPIVLSGDDQEEETEEEESEQTGGELKKDSQQAEQTGGEQEEEQRDDEDKERDQEEEEDDREEETEEEEDDREEETEKEESEQTEGEQEDEQRDDEDEERDQEEEEDDREEETEEEESDSEEETEEEESDSEEETEKEESEQTEGDQGDDEDEERDQCEINPTPPGTIKLGSLNVRSMTKKENVISELITRNKLDLLLINETWVKPKRLKVLHKASPKGFKAHYRVRPGKKKGGGVANLFSEALKRKPKSSDSPDKKIKTTTFEFVVTELQHDDWNQPVLIINLYRPPGKSKEEFRKFLDEFQSLLDEVEKKYSSFIVTGDFNIHVNKDRSYTDEFDFLLLVNNLTQHVKEPTHKAGNTLDLVITRNVEISGLKVRNEKNVVKSDHYTVYFYAKPEGTGEKTEENKNEEQKLFRQTEE